LTLTVVLVFRHDTQNVRKNIDSPRSKHREGESIYISQRGVGSMLNARPESNKKLVRRWETRTWLFLFTTTSYTYYKIQKREQNVFIFYFR